MRRTTTNLSTQSLTHNLDVQRSQSGLCRHNTQTDSEMTSRELRVDSFQTKPPLKRTKTTLFADVQRSTRRYYSEIKTERELKDLDNAYVRELSLSLVCFIVFFLSPISSSDIFIAFFF